MSALRPDDADRDHLLGLVRAAAETALPRETLPVAVGAGQALLVDSPEPASPTRPRRVGPPRPVERVRVAGA